MKRVLLILAVLIGMAFASTTPAQAWYRRGYYGAGYRPYGAYYRPYYAPRPYGAFYGGYPGVYGYGPGVGVGVGVY